MLMFFSFVSDAVEGVLGQIMQQGKVVQDAVEDPVNGFISTITGGAWEGDDADAMTQELTSVVLPMVADLIAAIFGMNSGITQAADNIKNADNSALGIVEDLVGGLFSSIF
jgi:hypothetical protein